MTREQLNSFAIAYIISNPERFNLQEKTKFLHEFENWISGKGDTISDNVYDFLTYVGFETKKPRHEIFFNYITEKYGDLKFKKVLDVGAGRLCRLSTLFAKRGALVSAIDPNIRISEREARTFGIQEILLQKFVCNQYAGRGKTGTNIQDYDLIVGLEPCDATEHIIRQCLMQDKHFEIDLCAAPHDALSGRRFKTYKEWYKHLENISSEVNISRVGSSNIATNNIVTFTGEKEM